MVSHKLQQLICGHDPDAAGGIARLRFGDVRDLRHVLRRQLPVVGGDHDAYAVLSHEGHSDLIALGRHQIFDLGLLQRVGRQDLDALAGLIGHALVRVLLLRRLL